MNLTLLLAPFQNITDPSCLTNLIVSVAVFILLDVATFFVFHRWSVRLTMIGTEIVFIVGYLLDLLPIMILSAVILAIVVIYSLVVNTGDARTFFSNTIKEKPLALLRLMAKRERRKKGEALFDRELVYGKVRDAVLWMSRQKMGAIITFEKKDNLDEQIKSGTVLNAPITTELLQTIFFPGTRLHDGAVVIRNDMIVAASVYYTPTRRPLTGKYGSRHRASLGISEICDAVTIVVSEETGRISIAYQGELNPVLPDQFMDTFMEFMMMEAEPQQN